MSLALNLLRLTVAFGFGWAVAWFLVLPNLPFPSVLSLLRVLSGALALAVIANGLMYKLVDQKAPEQLDSQRQRRWKRVRSGFRSTVIRSHILVFLGPIVAGLVTWAAEWAIPPFSQWVWASCALGFQASVIFWSIKTILFFKMLAEQRIKTDAELEKRAKLGRLFNSVDDIEPAPPKRKRRPAH